MLAHTLPAADDPVVQLSLNATKPWDYHLELGARPAPLRRHGVLIVGSGNAVHNLRKAHPAMADAGFDWAQRFDEDARAVMLDDPTEVAAASRGSGKRVHPSVGLHGDANAFAQFHDGRDIQLVIEIFELCREFKKRGHINDIQQQETTVILAEVQPALISKPSDGVHLAKRS